MAKFILRRFFYSIPVLLGILILTFALLRSIPGDPCRAILGERATDAVCDAFAERYGLNKRLLACTLPASAMLTGIFFDFQAFYKVCAHCYCASSY